MTEDERDELRSLHRLQEHLGEQGFTLNTKKKLRLLELEINKIWDQIN